MINTNETLNKQDIFNDFKNELDSFKQQIEKKEQWDTVNIDIEKYEQFLWKWLQTLENSVDFSDKQRF